MVKKAKAKKRVVRKAKVILPMKMSKLIGIALADLKKAEKQSKKYTIDMNDWYNPKAQLECRAPGGEIVAKHPTCTVCFAGAVMAFSLPKSRGANKPYEPSDFKGNSQQLEALNELRLGDVREAARNLGLCEWYDEKWHKFNQMNMDIPSYSNLNPKPFHAAMLKLKAKLAAAGY